MKILLSSDFHAASGYRTICEGITEGLVSQGCDVTVLGRGYGGDQHDFPYSVIPTDVRWLPQQIVRLSTAMKSDWIILMSDIPRLLAIVKSIEANVPGFLRQKQVAAIFPVESDPVTVAWTSPLIGLFSVRFTFTKMGANALKEKGVVVNLIPVGVDAFWKPEKQHSSPFNGRPYLLTIADNQFRKNLPASLEVAKRVIEWMHGDLMYVLVTNPLSKDGWRIDELLELTKFPTDSFKLIPFGVDREYLRYLYSYAKAFFLTSLAEGIGLPLYEAQACGCPAFITADTGGAEAVPEGHRFKVERQTLFPWGNVFHRWIDVQESADAILQMTQPTFQPFVSWQEAANKVVNHLSTYQAVREALNVKEPQQKAESEFI